jgi:hypothetical protein
MQIWLATAHISLLRLVEQKRRGATDAINRQGEDWVYAITAYNKLCSLLNKSKCFVLILEGSC